MSKSPRYESELLRFVHLRRPRLKPVVTPPTVTYPSAGFTPPNFYDTISDLTEEDKTFDNIKAEAEGFAAGVNYIKDKAVLETKIPNLLALMRKLRERGDANTAETFWNDVNSIMGQPPADYVAAAGYNSNLSLLWDNVMAGMFLEVSGQWLALVTNALVVLRLIKTHVDDWNTPIVTFARAQVLIPEWLYKVYQSKPYEDDNNVGLPAPSNQDVKDAIRQAKRLIPALDDLLTTYKYQKEGTNKVDISYVKANTREVLNSLDLINDDEFEVDESVRVVRAELQEQFDKYPQIVTPNKYTYRSDNSQGDGCDCCYSEENENDCEDIYPAQPYIGGNNYASRMYYGDLMITKQYLVKYEMNEVAHVETIMKGLKKTRTHRRLNREEIKEFFLKESSTEEERESQTTNRFSMEKETSKVVNQNLSINAGLNVSADFGIVQMDTSLGFSYSNSSTQSSQEASSFSKEVTSRALSRVRENVKETKETITIREVEETALHEVNNIDGTAHINGVYSWLEKRYLNKVFNYGKRLMMEFIVPEPANFYIFRQIKEAKSKKIKPIHPSSLTTEDLLVPLKSFRDVSESSYALWAAYYGVTNVPLPPPQMKMANKAFSLNSVENSDASTTVETIEVPEGYYAKFANVKVRFVDGETVSFSSYGIAVIQIGNKEVVHGYKGSSIMPVYGAASRYATQIANANNDGSYNINFGQGLPQGLTYPMDSMVPISAKIFILETRITHAIVNVQVWFERANDRALEAWKMEVYNAILQGYERQKADYEDWLAQQSFNSTGVQGNNPLINRQIEKEELKKRCIELFSGQRFDSFDAATNPLNNISGYPEIRFDEAKSEGVRIKYLEQVFDWKNMLYVFYPYFYGRKKRWVTIKSLRSDNDIIFQNFLHAGAARVVVPVRLGFEKYVLDPNKGYKYWADDQNPEYIPNGETEDILPILTEIMDAQDIDPEDLDNEPVGYYFHTVPTNLIFVSDHPAATPLPLPDNSTEPEIAPFL